MLFKIMKTDEVNNNGYIIPKKEIEEYLEKRYDGEDILCNSDPYQRRLSNDNVTHIIKDLKLDGHFLVANITVVDPVLMDMIENPDTKFAASYQAKTGCGGLVSNIHEVKCFPTMELSFDDE